MVAGERGRRWRSLGSRRALAARPPSHSALQTCTGCRISPLPRRRGSKRSRVREFVFVGGREGGGGVKVLARCACRLVRPREELPHGRHTERRIPPSPPPAGPRRDFPVGPRLAQVPRCACEHDNSVITPPDIRASVCLPPLTDRLPTPISAPPPRRYMMNGAACADFAVSASRRRA